MGPPGAGEPGQSGKSFPMRPELQREWRRLAGDSLEAVAYYLRATHKREQQGLPCNGLSMDRRQPAQVAEAVHSGN
eukprot:7327086-Pyramimonas_sp.AAC.1